MALGSSRRVKQWLAAISGRGLEPSYLISKSLQSIATIPLDPGIHMLVPPYGRTYLNRPFGTSIVPVVCPHVIHRPIPRSTGDIGQHDIICWHCPWMKKRSLLFRPRILFSHDAEMHVLEDRNGCLDCCSVSVHLSHNSFLLEEPKSGDRYLIPDLTCTHSDFIEVRVRGEDFGLGLRVTSRGDPLERLAC